MLQQYMPHGFCINWDPELLLTMVVGDGLIAIAYLFISIMLFTYIPKATGIVMGGLKPFLYLFGLFILSCGITHIFAIISFWYPLYHIQSIFLIFTMIVSCITAFLLYIRRDIIAALFKM